MSETKFPAVFELAALGMARTSAVDARWVDVNDAFCKMLGRSRSNMLATAWPDMTHPDDLIVGDDLSEQWTTGDSYAVEKRLLHANGTYVWTRLTFSMARDALGRPDYEVAIIEDITELRDAQARSLEADRRKDEFLAMLSHELRNPLAPIRNSLYILDKADPLGPQARTAKAVINRQISYLTNLVDDLLDVTRIASGKIELHCTRLDFAELVRRTAEDYRVLTQERGLQLIVSIAQGPLMIRGDETRLAQLLGNLLANAAKFTPAGGKVMVDARGDGERAFCEHPRHRCWNPGAIAVIRV